MYPFWLYYTYIISYYTLNKHYIIYIYIYILWHYYSFELTNKQNLSICFIKTVCPQFVYTQGKLVVLDFLKKETVIFIWCRQLDIFKFNINISIVLKHNPDRPIPPPPPNKNPKRRPCHSLPRNSIINKYHNGKSRKREIMQCCTL